MGLALPVWWLLLPASGEKERAYQFAALISLTARE